MKRFESAVLSALCAYEWPERQELRNVVEGLVLMATGDTISISDLPAELTSSRSAPIAHAA